jgi:hypothetical protein
MDFENQKILYVLQCQDFWIPDFDFQIVTQHFQKAWRITFVQLLRLLQPGIFE